MNIINKIICGNCIQIMSGMPVECIDLVITSPPYDDLRTYKNIGTNAFKFEEIANMLYRVIKLGGVVVWVVGDATIKGSETGTAFKQALYFKEIGFNLHDTMIFQKKNFSFPSRTRYHQTFEYMFVLSKGKPKTFNPIEDRKVMWKGTWGNLTVRHKDGTLETKNKKSVYKDYSMRTNVWLYSTGYTFGNKNKESHKHPAIFPDALARDHILSWSNEGDLVLDPMCGSGTVLEQAKLLGRDYIGIDVVKEYCDLSRRRVNGITK